MICKKCGQEFPDSGLPGNCPHCGEPLDPETSSPDTAQEGLAPEADGSQNGQESSQSTEEAPQSPEEPDGMREGQDSPAEEGPAAAPEASASRSKTPLIIGIVAILAVVVLCVFLFGNRSGGQTVTADSHYNPTYLRYTTESGISLMKNGQSTQLFTNAGADLNSHSAINQMLSSITPYVGGQNYVELGNGDLVYIDTTFSGIDEQTGQPDSSKLKGKLFLKQEGKEPSLIDEDVQVIYCSNKQELFYTKLEDNKLVEYHYKDGKTQKADDVTGRENSVVIEISEDSSLMGALFLDESGQIAQAGYWHNGAVHTLEEGYSLYGISPDGKQVYAVKSDPATNLTTLYAVEDLNTASLKQVGEGITEILMFADTGSVAFIGDCDVSKGKMNPVGSVYFYDTATGESRKMADDATAILEAFPRTQNALNENGKDILPSETKQIYTVDKPLASGQIHYFDSNGNLKVISEAATPGESGLDGTLLCANMYNPEAYSLNQDVRFTTYSGDSLYWSKGAEVARYRLGSLSAPEIVPLDEDLQSKANAYAQMGYMITGSGDIIEETGDKVILRLFNSEKTTPILENMGTLSVIGLDNDGKNIFFLSEDKSIYSKSVTSRSNPKLIASNVWNAAAASDGLYILRDYEDGVGGTLDLLPYGEKEASTVAEKVLSIVAVPLSK